MNPGRYTAKRWGHELEIVNTAHYCGKRMAVHKGWRCSLHHHHDKDETFWVESGVIFMETSAHLVSYEGFIQTGGIIRVPPMTWHRFTAMSDEVLIFEFSTHHDDADTLRDTNSPSGQVPKEEWEALRERYRRSRVQVVL